MQPRKRRYLSIILIMVIFSSFTLILAKSNSPKIKYLEGASSFYTLKSLDFKIHGEINLSSLKLYLDGYQDKNPVLGEFTLKDDILTFKTKKIYSGNYILLGDFGLYRFKIGIVKTNIDDCENELSVKERCISDYLVSQAIRDGNVQNSLKTVKSIFENYKDGITFCHTLAHDLGDFSPLIYKDFTDAIKDADSICVEGYFHGVMETFHFYWSDEELASNITYLCKYGKADNINKDSCYHGVGHLVMARFHDFIKATTYCKKIDFEKSFGVYRPIDSCISGVSMSWADLYSRSTQEVRKKLWPLETSPINICEDIFEGDDLNYQACYANITSVYFFENDMKEKIINSCQNFTGSRLLGCYQSLSMYLQLKKDENIDTIKVACASAKEDPAMYRCLSELISSMASRNYVNIDLKGRKPAEYLCDFTRSINRFDKKFCDFMNNQPENHLNG